MKQRDYQDTDRAAAPLKQAEDAVLLDTSELDFEQSLAAMKKIIAKKVKTDDDMMLYYILLPFAWLLWHLGFRIRVEGRENLKKVQTKGYILAPTHVSAIDPVFIAVTRWGGRMVIFAKKELFEINVFLSWFFRCCGGVCVRGTKDEVAVIAQTVEACEKRTHAAHPSGGTRAKRRKTAAAQERPVRDRSRGRGGRGALPHPVRHPGRENAPVLQGAGDLR